MEGKLEGDLESKLEGDRESDLEQIGASKPRERGPSDHRRSGQFSPRERGHPCALEAAAEIAEQDHEQNAQQMLEVQGARQLDADSLARNTLVPALRGEHVARACGHGEWQGCALVAAGCLTSAVQQHVGGAVGAGIWLGRDEVVDCGARGVVVHARHARWRARGRACARGYRNASSAIARGNKKRTLSPGCMTSRCTVV